MDMCFGIWNNFVEVESDFQVVWLPFVSCIFCFKQFCVFVKVKG